MIAIILAYAVSLILGAFGTFMLAMTLLTIARDDVTHAQSLAGFTVGLAGVTIAFIFAKAAGI